MKLADEIVLDAQSGSFHIDGLAVPYYISEEVKETKGDEPDDVDSVTVSFFADRIVVASPAGKPEPVSEAPLNWGPEMPTWKRIAGTVALNDTAEGPGLYIDGVEVPFHIDGAFTVTYDDRLAYVTVTFIARKVTVTR